MKLMILGAGVYQVPLIRKAKEMGHETLVVSPMGKYPGLSIADKVIACDTRDKDAVLRAAIDFGIDGIVTTGTDVAVPTIGYVVDKLNLKGTGFQAAERSMNKALMKRCFIENGVKTAFYKIVSSIDDLLSVADEIGYPLMVKAVDSSGSRGITKVECREELLPAFDSARLVSSNKEVIIEEFLNGIEFGADAVVADTEVVEVFIHSKLVTPPPTSAPIGHSMPISLPDNIRDRVREVITRAVKSLGISNTISNADIMLVDNTPYIIEIGARMGATCIPENISLHSKFDIYEYLVNLALGLFPALPACITNQPNASQLIIASKSGTVKDIYVPEYIKAIPNLVSLSLDISVGDTVREVKVGPDRIGHVITTGKTELEAVALAREIVDAIVISIN